MLDSSFKSSSVFCLKYAIVSIPELLDFFQFGEVTSKIIITIPSSLLSFLLLPVFPWQVFCYLFLRLVVHVNLRADHLVRISLFPFSTYSVRSFFILSRNDLWSSLNQGSSMLFQLSAILLRNFPLSLDPGLY